VIGLIGGVGSGKSALAAFVGEKRDVELIDGDRLGHELLTDCSVQSSIRERFGGSVFDENGAVDRAILGREVFGSGEQHRSARRDLEQILHPRIRNAIVERIERARGTGKVDAVILDAAVLIEAGWDDLCDAVVFVDTDYRQRLNRVVRNRGWDEEKFLARESNQLTLEDKRSAANVIIDNSGSLEEAGGRLTEILTELIQDHV
jgi:dephospho-CoA kinase